jgi:hypothetical protein
VKVEGGKEGAAEPALAPKALLEEARGMRQDDKALAGVVDRARDELKEAPRGRNGDFIPLGSFTVAPHGTAQVRVDLLGPNGCTISLSSPPPAPAPVVTVTGPAAGQAVPLQASSGGMGITRYSFTGKMPGGFVITVRNPTNATLSGVVVTYL